MSDHRRRPGRLSRSNSEGTRPYRQRARAEQQALTRRRIAAAAVELHASIGPARTTISAIADRAGVERLTVYRHFPDEEALFAGCSTHFLQEHPPPDLAVPMAIGDPALRTEAVLLTLYRYYRETEPMLSALFRDAPMVPLVAAYLAPYVTMLNDVADGLTAAMAKRRERPTLRAAAGHALAFTTWRSLAIDQGLDDDSIAALMARFVADIE